MAVQVHFIEHSSMPTDGISAITDAASKHVGVVEHFDDATTFATARRKVEAAMKAAPSDLHMVVVCTHGWEDTGTWLCMGEGNAPFAVLDKLFSWLPPQALIYMSVCWGGYTGNVTRIQACGTAGRPVVAGALVPLAADEGDDLQDQLMSVLVQHGLDDAKLREVVVAFNAKLQPFYGQQAARIALTTGGLEPKQGAAGIAWSLLELDDGSAHEGPFTVTAVNGREITLSDGTSEWVAAGGWIERAKKGAPVAIGDRYRFKAKKHPDKNVLIIVPPVRVA